MGMMKRLCTARSQGHPLSAPLLRMVAPHLAPKAGKVPRDTSEDITAGPMRLSAAEQTEAQQLYQELVADIAAGDRWGLERSQPCSNES